MADGTTATARARPRRAHKAAAITTPDPIEIALETQTDQGPARALLLRQTELIEADLRHRRLQIAGERVSNLLKIGAALAGLAAVGVLAAMALSASRANGLVIDQFEVAPALAARGVTGEVVSRQVMGHLSNIVLLTNSSEAQRSIQAVQPAEISIEIPQTGVSVSQLDQWLRQSLGRETHVSGEVMLQPDGQLALQLRSGIRQLPLLVGPQQDLPKLVQQAAEAVYAVEQPRSYGAYLSRQGRFTEARENIRRLARSGSAGDRAWANHGLGVLAAMADGDLAARAAYWHALALQPLAITYANLSNTEVALGHTELAITDLREAEKMNLRPDNPAEETPEVRKQRDLSFKRGLAIRSGDFTEALRLENAYALTPRAGTSSSSEAPIFAGVYTGLHELARAENELDGFDPVGPEALDKANRTLNLKLQAEDWPAVVTAANSVIDAQSRWRPDGGVARPVARASKALALAKLGNIPEASALIATTPLDCEPCVRIRGRISAAAGDVRSADHWFGEAVRLAPSSPFARTEWGRALLERKSYAAAEGQFELAHRVSPAFADPLTYWGEARLAQGDTAGAAQKFAQAAKLAPRWGRLYLKWGDALAAQGKREQAHAKWQAAARMDLLPAERAALATISAKRTG